MPCFRASKYYLTLEYIVYRIDIVTDCYLSSHEDIYLAAAQPSYKYHSTGKMGVICAVFECGIKSAKCGTKSTWFGLSDCTGTSLFVLKLPPLLETTPHARAELCTSLLVPL